jgi:hypothetical protein
MKKLINIKYVFGGFSGQISPKTFWGLRRSRRAALSQLLPNTLSGSQIKVLEVKIMTRKLIFGLLFLIMAASVSACGLAETRHDDTSQNEKDQNCVIIGGQAEFSVTGKVK